MLDDYFYDKNNNQYLHTKELGSFPLFQRVSVFQYTFFQWLRNEWKNYVLLCNAIFYMSTSLCN